MSMDVTSPARQPVSRAALPYGCHWIDEDDIEAVVQALRSDWLTTGPKVAEFEQALADYVGATEAVAVSNGTAALHAAMYAIGIGPGDEVIVPAMTFAATANCVVYQGGTPVFADVDRGTLLIDPASVQACITRRTRAIVAVDYAGQPCEYDRLRAIADRYGLALVADACHSLGASYRGKPVGSLADISAFSFHPVKPITTGEGGAVVTRDPELARRARRFCNHGIATNYRQREQQGTWFYEVVDLGYNYRLTDIQCALGLSQLRKLPTWTARRQEIAGMYGRGFGGQSSVVALSVRKEVSHAYHLYVVRWRSGVSGVGRAEAFRQLWAAGIGVNVHYIPVHLHPLYRARFGTQPGLCPVAENAYREILSLPIYPRMADSDVQRVISEVLRFAEGAERLKDRAA